jgi:ketosteroid isomerase-like protein
MRQATLGAVIVLVALSSALAQTASADEAAIRAIFSRMEQYYADCNSKAMAQLFAEDAERVWAGATVKGRASIEATYDAQCHFTKGGKNTFKLSISFPTASTAHIDGIWTNETTARSAPFVVTAAKHADQWLFTRGQPR